MKKELIDPLTDLRWADSLRGQPGYSVFHSSCWAKVLATTYGFRPRYFLVRANGGVGALPVMEIRSRLTGLRGVSLPFSDYCEPLAETPEVFGTLFDEALDYGRRSGWDYLELRGGGRFFDTLGGAVPYGEYYTHTIDLSPGEKALFGGLSPSTRRNIKKAIAGGVKVSIGSAPEDVSIFYRLNCETRKRHGLPPQPYLFFEKLREHLLSRDNGFVALASDGKDFMAGAVFLLSGRQAVYKYGASDVRFSALRPNNLVMWEAIRLLSRNGVGALDLGRTDTCDEGLRRYKTGWGARQSNIAYFRYDFKKGSFVEKKGSGFYRKVFRITPLFFLKLIGKNLYKHLQ